MTKHFIHILLFFPVLSYSQPLEPLFQLLPPGRTGVYFENTITDEKEHNILLYSNYYGGAGVGVGDFNRDGRPDLFFAGNLVADQLYFNAGDLRFENVTQQAGIRDNGGWSSGVLVGDVNNDGWDDIYVTRELYDDKPDLRRNILYINQQNGTFREEAAAYGLDDPERTRHATFIDYNKDGWLDLFLLNQPPNPGNYSSFYGADLMREEWAPRLYRNNKNGSFSDVSKEAGVLKPGYGNSAVAADLNNDGWMDLYVANDYEAPDFLYLNNGDGTFTDVLQQATNHISYYAMGVDAADINNDGWLDVMTLDMVAEDNFRLKSNMGGMYPEAFWKIVRQGGHFQYMFNALHINQGYAGKEKIPRFSDLAQLAGISNTDWSWSNLIADLDNDGWKDIFVTNGLLRDIRNSDAAKTFPKYVQHVIEDYIAAHPNEGDVSIFDILDLDEALQLIPSVPLKNYVFRNNGDLTFTKKTEEWGLDMESFSNGSAYADLDNDGDLDLIVNNINAPAHVLENKSSQNWLRIQLTDNLQHRTLTGTRAKIEVNGQSQYSELTQIRGMYSSSENVLHFGLGHAEKAERLILYWMDGTQSILTDIPTNQVLEIDAGQIEKTALVQTATSCWFTPSEGVISYKHQENDFDDYEKQVLLPHKMSQFGPALAATDVNGDGRQDVFSGGAVGQPGTLFFQQPDGTFKMVQTFTGEQLQEDMDAVFFDAEGDGDPDLYVVSGGNAFPPQNKYYQDRLYLNDGKGNFELAAEALPVFRDSGSKVRPADFDGDGDIDLFVGGRHTPWSYPTPATSRLLRNDGGMFTDITKTAAPDLIQAGLLTDALWSDFDQDNDPDLIIAGEWMPIRILQNNSGTFHPFTPSILDSFNPSILQSFPSGWWYSLEAADIDGDGDEDYFVGNLGLNYKYKASVEEPFEVHYDDFDGNGSKDIVLSYYNFGEQFPLRGRSCSSEQIPTLKEKFPSYNKFAAAKLSDVYGEEKLEKALHYSASTFASMYIENLGKGSFRLSRLPNEAQVSSINDFIVDDFDGDGFKDVMLAGNLFTSEIETPRNDAGTGLILKGDGGKSWTPVHPVISGLYLSFDIKQIRRVEVGERTLFLFGVNDGDLQVVDWGKNLKH